MMKKFNSKNKGRAILQILILVIGIFAMSYAVGSSIGEVSALEECGVDNTCPDGETCHEGQCLNENEINTGVQEDPSTGLPTKKYTDYDYAEIVLNAYGGDKEKTIAEFEKAEKDKNGESAKAIDKILDPFGKIISTAAGYTALKDALKGGAKKTAEKVGEEASKKLFEGWFREGLFNSFGQSRFAQTATAAANAAVGAFIVWGFYKWVVKADVRNMRDITVAAGVGITTVTLIAAFGGPVGWIALGTAAGITALISLFTFKNYSQEVFTYIATAWKAPDGGEDCEKCNDLRYGCSEYQCKSFGKACEIANPGTEQEVCVWENPDDIFSPEITALQKSLPSPQADYSYEPLPAVQGVKITYSKDPKGNGCVPPYTALDLGVETNEFAECKIDTIRKPNFDEMAAPMAKLEGFLKEHILSLPHIATPSVESQKAIGILDAEITNGQAQEFYIRCKDLNGNYNEDEFIMEFCVQDSPDTSAPIITGTNFLKYLKTDQTDASLEVYTNEPADCKWSPEDLDYEQMQFDMTQCSQTEGDYLFAGFRYGCKGMLTGLKKGENNVYIRCNDKPWWTSLDAGQRYANENSFKLSLIGTEPLVINEITVNGQETGATIKDSTTTIKAKLKVTTSAGAENGKARCSYESAGNFVDFYNEGSAEFVNINTQNLYLAEGDYTLKIRCEDAGGNRDEGEISFKVDTDTEVPFVVRAYKDGTQLKIITNEESMCTYTTNKNIGCGYVFDDGEEMKSIENTHFTTWNPNKEYYIKCKDVFENSPAPDQCSIIVRAFEL